MKFEISSNMGQTHVLSCVICQQLLSWWNMAEKLCLKWNDFQENVNTAFVNLRGNNDFSDVTLACEDGQQFEAHKVILVASSPFFHELLKRNKHNHPLIYMRGLKSEDLSAIIDFLYCGEANICHENLDSFLAIAEELKLKGLMGQTDDKEEQSQNLYVSPNSMQTEIKPVVKLDKRQPARFKSVYKEKQPMSADKNVDQISKYFSGDFQELDDQVKSLMEISQNIIPNGKMQTTRAKICKACGKEGAPSAIRDHIEIHHLEGVSLPCNACEKTFRSRKTLRQHKCKSWIKIMR